MRILVTGSNGMMGWGIKKVFPEKSLILTDRSNFDVTHSLVDNPLFKRERPDAIIHAAAETDHHRAQANPEHTYMVNHTGTANVLECAREYGIPLIYISTIGIFDGEKKSYKEQDRPFPINHYARSKYLAEELVKSYTDHLIVRAGWGMGGGTNVDKKFVNKIYKKIVDGEKVIWAINDVFGSPTYTPDFAEAFYALMFSRPPDRGIYHIAPPDSCSRYELAKEFIRILGVNVEVKGVSKKEYHEMFPQTVQYQDNEVADTSLIQSLGIEMRPWREALAEYVYKFF